MGKKGELTLGLGSGLGLDVFDVMGEQRIEGLGSRKSR